MSEVSPGVQKIIDTKIDFTESDTEQRERWRQNFDQALRSISREALVHELQRLQPQEESNPKAATAIEVVRTLQRMKDLSHYEPRVEKLAKDGLYDLVDAAGLMSNEETKYLVRALQNMLTTWQNCSSPMIIKDRKLGGLRIQQTSSNLCRSTHQNEYSINLKITNHKTI